MCSKLTINATQRDATDVVLVSSVLTLNIVHAVFSITVVGFGQINVCQEQSRLSQD